jgi:hypothetical protein
MYYFMQRTELETVRAKTSMRMIPILCPFKVYLPVRWVDLGDFYMGLVSVSVSVSGFIIVIVVIITTR